MAPSSMATVDVRMSTWDDSGSGGEIYPNLKTNIWKVVLTSDLGCLNQCPHPVMAMTDM